MIAISRRPLEGAFAPTFRIAASMALVPLLLLAPLAAHGAATTTSVTPLQTLDFGKFVVLPSCSSCTITISSSGAARTASTGIVLITTSPGRPATYNVACSGNCNYTAAMTGSPKFVAGSSTMTMGTMTYAKSPATGAGALTVGATLMIPGPGATPGSYTSSGFTITTSP